MKTSNFARPVHPVGRDTWTSAHPIRTIALGAAVGVLMLVAGLRLIG